MTPAIERAGWDTQTQVGEELWFTAGSIRARGKRTLVDPILCGEVSLINIDLSGLKHVVRELARLNASHEKPISHAERIV